MSAAGGRWTARDWRQSIALLLLSMAAIPLTGVVYYALWIVSYAPSNDNAFWIGIAAAGLILSDLIGVSAILGRRTFRFKVGDAEVHAEGEEGDAVLEQAT